MTIKESNVTINVSDIDKSISFYESIGFKLKNRWGNHYARLTAPGITIGLHPTSDSHLSGQSGNISIGLTVEDFGNAISFLQTLSIRVKEREEEGGRFLHFEDPDGTAIYFIEPRG